MSKFTSEMVDDYADKLLIGLSKEENDLVLKEFDIIDENMQKIANMEGISNVEAMTHALDDFTYDLREDIANDSIAIEDLSSPYVNIIAARSEDKDNPALLRLVELLRSEETQQFILDTWNGSVVPATE